MANYHYYESSDAHLPPGFRFHPTDEELITYYLLKKVLDSNFTGKAIAEVDLNKCEPWELPGTLKFSKIKLTLLFVRYELVNLALSKLQCFVQRKPRWGGKNGTFSA